ncbi:MULTISPECIES: RebB family R body protein [Pseudoalteromonas]|uniref:Glycerol-3-phosphate dehydrogenase subunit C n=6 Tax=Pseudoalteromonas TaxID=53246 RepID=A0A166W4K0_9GAMM|nr:MULTISPECIES: RebB family R body protein [Pseudoalteromonas]ESP91328.1 Killing trait [Pseudoalteromonas luteoviolacea 2ta16]KZN34731.1 glycerol-3-phosphate dehydrogenase subunit C [Pseudoalteromonas luteoviolacea S2607]KZN35401.1 glycerol-3-phosphate dehydrogenase subunit C [Pseudoalteromonas luteoviolacea DSM 6061]KZN39648.1 glycerol-3-phosphate dehydrogenase subunit C [Pseudoalteromonas luteoviolacea NCIMB 1944]KZN46954.1 glycerol-3-phosphate dehydrogenase subunit C [Pseudoalteromonas lut
MADTVNAAITDSVTQVNTKVVGETPAMAMGNLLMSTSQALSNAAHNATSAQQQAQITMQAATVQGVNSLMSIGSSVVGRSAEGIIEKG